jgi:hypothetical protein
MKGNELVWAFDLGKASIGEAVRRGNQIAEIVNQGAA